jgi:hypothetical protein
VTKEGSIAKREDKKLSKSASPRTTTKIVSTDRQPENHPREIEPTVEKSMAWVLFLKTTRATPMRIILKVGRFERSKGEGRVSDLFVNETNDAV